jgi:hypothetical protein
MQIIINFKDEYVQDVILAKRGFSTDSPLSWVTDSAGRYLSSLEQGGSEQLEKILESIQL